MLIHITTLKHMSLEQHDSRGL